jgi:hypothetical protein
MQEVLYKSKVTKLLAWENECQKATIPKNKVNDFPPADSSLTAKVSQMIYFTQCFDQRVSPATARLAPVIVSSRVSSRERMLV